MTLFRIGLFCRLSGVVVKRLAPNGGMGKNVRARGQEMTGAGQFQQCKLMQVKGVSSNAKHVGKGG
jgi:hypothetical protein